MRINKAENWKELNKDVQEQGLSSRQARRENGLLVSCSHSERLDVSNEEFFAILAKSNGEIPNQEIGKDRKKPQNIKHSGNISLDDVIEIARVMKPRLMAKELARIVKEILGSCVSVGCTVEDSQGLAKWDR